MLNSKGLRTILKEIYGVDDKYLVPISTNWYVPTVDPDDKIGTWIGYRVISKKPIVRAYQSGTHMVSDIRVPFRISFVGPQAEELADQTLLWDVRTDVIEAFARQKAQVNYTDRTMFSYPVRQGGMNDELAWIVDLSVQTFYEIDTNQHPWFSPRDKRRELNGYK